MQADGLTVKLTDSERMRKWQEPYLGDRMAKTAVRTRIAGPFRLASIAPIDAATPLLAMTPFAFWGAGAL
jgi:hypothetical protein